MKNDWSYDDGLMGMASLSVSILLVVLSLPSFLTFIVEKLVSIDQFTFVFFWKVGKWLNFHHFSGERFPFILLLYLQTFSMKKQREGIKMYYKLNLFHGPDSGKYEHETDHTTIGMPSFSLHQHQCFLLLHLQLQVMFLTKGYLFGLAKLI